MLLCCGTCPEFSTDGTKVLTGDRDGNGKLWDASTGECVRVFSTKNTPGGMIAKFSPDGRKVLTAGVSATDLWDSATGMRIQTFDQSDRAGLGPVEFSP